MERREKVEIIQQAIRQLMEEEEEENTKSSSSSSDDNNFVAVDDENSGRRRRQILSKLLSELDSMESKEEKVNNNNNASIEADNIHNEGEIIIIIKELKNLKRQNSITHWLLSAMIVITLAWQLSEVSLILRIKNGLTNPLKSVGGIVGGFLKAGRRAEADVQEAMKQASNKQKQVVECTSLPGLKIPHLDLPGFDTSEED